MVQSTGKVPISGMPKQMVGSHTNSCSWCFAALLLLVGANALSRQLPEEVDDFILVREEGLGWLYSPVAEEEKILEETILEVKKRRDH